MSGLLPSEQRALSVALTCFEYLARSGWRREEPGSGWWWHDEETDLHLLGEAVDIQLQRDGIDTRLEP